MLTHLDCDHVSGLKDLKGAKHIYATKEELEISLFQTQDTVKRLAGY
ncbi:MAG: hypothetical protein ACLR6O_05875 [Eubacterium sp.]